MKKIILSTATVLILSVSAMAQIRVGVKAGASLDNQKMNVNQGSMYAGSDYKGFHAGLVSEVNLTGNFYLQPQLLFSRKGATHLSSMSAHETKIRLSYVELPVNLVYKFDLPFGNLF